MNLTPEQLEAARNGEPVRFAEAGSEFVVLRADVYERLRSSLYDASPWTDEEMDLLTAEDADALGWEGMDEYDSCEKPQ
jgi:hypothetical protein